MNHHYPFVPPGYIFYPPPGPPRYPPYAAPGAPHNGAVYPYPPPGRSLNGGYHPYPHPQAPYAAPHGMLHPERSYTVDGNVWYTPHSPQAPPPPVLNGPNSSPHTPPHPPGLGLPVNGAPLPHLPVDKPESATAAPGGMHEYWAGRLAPLPGYESRPILLPMRGGPLDKKSDTKEKEENPISELLPPQSFYSPGYKRKTISNTSDVNTTSTKEKTDNSKTSKNTKKESKPQFVLDKYAESFVPGYLYKIQREAHSLKPLPATPVFPSILYLNSFLSSKLIKEICVPSLLLDQPAPKDSKPPPFIASKYKEHWADILRWELDAIALDKEQIVLWTHSAKVAIWKDSEFVFSVPGIRENYPYLEVGDLVHLREVLVSEKRGSNRAVEGRVVALRKREGLVNIHSPPLKEHIQTYVPITNEVKTENGLVVYGEDEVIPFVFNISFVTNSRPLCAMQTAVDTVSQILTSEKPGTNLAQQWIFPEVDDFTNKPCVMLRNSVNQDTQWEDPGLNVEQRLAVTSVSLYQSPVPRLISGPAGTGKTRTVVEAVIQIFRVQPESCILLCAPSNPATDTLVLRLQKSLDQHEMLRLNDPNRTFAEVPDKIMSYCYVEDNKFALPPWNELMKYRVVVTSCLDANILVQAQCTNTTLMAMETEVTESLHPHRRPKHVVQPHWTHLIIDEAAQGSEPELLIPISVVLPDVYGEDIKGRTFMPQLTLCGDINQLGPNVVSSEARNAELEVSLLERLFDRPLYSSYMNDVHTQMITGSKRIKPYTTLVKNYRSHPVILMPPSALFYNDTLQPFATANGTITWPGLAKPNMPLKFIGMEAPEKSNDDRASWYNPGQNNKIVNIIKSLLDNPRLCDPPLKANEIGVMAPWRQQVWVMRKRLRDEYLSAVDVGTVEDYQGRESRVIIISCVRSSERFLDEDHKKGIGLIFQRKRMNVAITRAKELMIVVGNGALLKRDPYWKSFLQFCIRNGLYDGPELSLDMDGSYISRLESKLIHSGKFTFDPEVEGLMIAGGVAREALKE